MSSVSTTTIYTDGSCTKIDPKSSTGPGGWGFAIYTKDDDLHFAASGGEADTTNNRMEMMAVIEALKFTIGQDVAIHTDSDYTRRCATGKWKRSKNIDLWNTYDKVAKGRKVEWVKVKAHSGIKGNEYVDRLANMEAREQKNSLVRN